MTDLSQVPYTGVDDAATSPLTCEIVDPSLRTADQEGNVDYIACHRLHAEGVERERVFSLRNAVDGFNTHESASPRSREASTRIGESDSWERLMTFVDQVRTFVDVQRVPVTTDCIVSSPRQRSGSWQFPFPAEVRFGLEV